MFEPRAPFSGGGGLWKMFNKRCLKRRENELYIKKKKGNQTAADCCCVYFGCFLRNWSRNVSRASNPLSRYLSLLRRSIIEAQAFHDTSEFLEFFFFFFFFRDLYTFKAFVFYFSFYTQIPMGTLQAEDERSFERAKYRNSCAPSTFSRSPLHFKN